MAAYKVGDYIVHEKSGVCQIVDIQIMEMQGRGSEKEYYCLAPYKQTNSQIFTPVDDPRRLRDIVSKQDAEDFLERVDELEIVDEPNERARVEICKQMVATSDLNQIGSVIKTLYIKKNERLAKGKRMMTQDERIMNVAVKKLFDELAFALECDTEAVNDRFYASLGLELTEA